MRRQNRQADDGGERRLTFVRAPVIVENWNRFTQSISWKQGQLWWLWSDHIIVTDFPYHVNKLFRVDQKFFSSSLTLVCFSRKDRVGDKKANNFIVSWKWSKVNKRRWVSWESKENWKSHKKYPYWLYWHFCSMRWRVYALLAAFFENDNKIQHNYESYLYDMVWK